MVRTLSSMRFWKSPTAPRVVSTMSAAFFSVSARNEATGWLIVLSKISPPLTINCRSVARGRVFFLRFSASKRICASVTAVRSSLVVLSMMRTSSPVRTNSEISSSVT